MRALNLNTGPSQGLCALLRAWGYLAPAGEPTRYPGACDGPPWSIMSANALRGRAASDGRCADARYLRAAKRRAPKVRPVIGPVVGQECWADWPGPPDPRVAQAAREAPVAPIARKLDRTGVPVSAGSGHGFRECGGRPQRPRHDRAATPSSGKQPVSVTGTIGTGPAGWDGQVSFVITSPSMRRERAGIGKANLIGGMIGR